MKRKKLGFKQAFEYVLDLLCYSYYVKADNLVSDQTFDELEKLYCKIFDVQTAPNRGKERKGAYTNGVKAVYDLIKNPVNKELKLF